MEYGQIVAAATRSYLARVAATATQNLVVFGFFRA